jgi:hypothetical protein
VVVGMCEWRRVCVQYYLLYVMSEALASKRFHIQWGCFAEGENNLSTRLTTHLHQEARLKYLEFYLHTEWDGIALTLLIHVREVHSSNLCRGFLFSLAHARIVPWLGHEQCLLVIVLLSPIHSTVYGRNAGTHK